MDEPARNFVDTLFNTYKYMSCKLLSSDKLLNATKQTTSQILEDATKVRELLRIDDDQGLYDQRMEVDSQTTTVPSSSIFRTEHIQPVPPSLMSTQHPISFTINIGRVPSSIRTSRSSAHSSDLFTLFESAPRNSNSVESSSNTVGTMSEIMPSSFSTLTERSVNNIIYRCHRLVGDLIACIGKIFCNSNVIKVKFLIFKLNFGFIKIRQRLTLSLQLSQETIKKDFRTMSALVFGGVQRLFQPTELDSAVR